jgi:hypothetical protein
VAIRIGYVGDWETRLLGRLYTQYKDKVTWQQWVTEIIAPQAQALEESAQQLLGLNDIDNSSGIQLDIIGRKIGQQRAGWDDPTYRLMLKARAAANVSDGSSELIYPVMRALYGASIGMVITTYQIRTFELRIKGAITSTMAALGPGFLQDAKEAAARGIFLWQEYDDGLIFEFGNASYLSAGIGAGVASLPVFSIGGTGGAPSFPATGSVRIDRGTAAQEEVAYSSVTGGTTINLASVTALAHDKNASVELSRVGSSPIVSIGFGVGYLEGAANAA